MLEKIKTNHKALIDKFICTPEQKTEISLEASTLQKCLAEFKKHYGELGVPKEKKLKSAETKVTTAPTQHVIKTTFELGNVIMKGELKKIPELVAKGGDINAVLIKDGPNNVSVLHFAILTYNNALLDALLKIDNLDINISLNNHQPPLISALCAGTRVNTYAFNKILNHPDYEINACTAENASPLHCALEENVPLEIFEALLAKADPNLMDLLSDTPLLTAIKRKLWDKVNLLLEPQYNVDVSLTEENFFSPFETLFEEIVQKADNHTEIQLAQKLVRHPKMRFTEGEYGYEEVTMSVVHRILPLIKTFKSLKKFDCNKPIQERSPLEIAISGDDLPFTLFLLDEPGIDLSFTDENHSTALHLSIIQKQTAIFKLLSARPEIDKRARNNAGQEPVHYAAAYSLPILQDILLKDPDLITSKTLSDFTPILSAVVHGNLETVEWLALKFPQCLDDVDYCGNTILEIAVNLRHVEIVEFIMSVKPDLLMPDFTAFKYAFVNDDLPCFKALLFSSPEMRSSIQIYFDTNPLLHLAVLYDAQEILTYLLPPPNSAEQDFASKKEESLTSYLKINVNETFDDVTALHLAAITQHYDAAEILLKHGCDPLTPDSHGFTVEQYSNLQLSLNEEDGLPGSHINPRVILTQRLRTLENLQYFFPTKTEATTVALKQTPTLVAEVPAEKEFKVETKSAKPPKKSKLSDFFAKATAPKIREEKGRIIETKEQTKANSNFFSGQSLSKKDKDYLAQQNIFYIETAFGAPKFLVITKQLLQKIDLNHLKVIQEYLRSSVSFCGQMRSGIKLLTDAPIFELCLKKSDFRILAKKQFKPTQLKLADNSTISGICLDFTDYAPTHSKVKNVVANMLKSDSVIQTSKRSFR